MLKNSVRNLGALMAFVVVALASHAFAQQVDVKGVDTDAEETTITVKKGKSGSTAQATCQPVFQVENGTEDVVGDGAPMNKPARANWKRSCDEWKKEFRANNQGNRIISMSCGVASCGTEGAETVCKSTATYRVRVKLTE